MRYKILLPLVVLMLTVFSCEKKPPYTPTPVLLLKDITFANLPSPYYHVEYDDILLVKKISFASGQRVYDLFYNNSELIEMRNNTAANQDRIAYVYEDNGRLGMIKFIHPTNGLYRYCFLTYQGNDLRLIEWYRRVAPGFVLDRTMAFVYHADGNLLEMTDHKLPVNGQQENTAVTRYEDYDNKINPDRFSAIHDGNEHVLFLQTVLLQKNNPRKETYSTPGLGYTINYTYTYNSLDGPITKTGDAIFTDGPNTGQRFQVNGTFTYY